MKEVFEEYGTVIYLTIVAAMCLIMFCNAWFGSGSIVGNLSYAVFTASDYKEYHIDSIDKRNLRITVSEVKNLNPDMKSTSDNGIMSIMKSDGTRVVQTASGYHKLEYYTNGSTISNSQLNSAIKSEDVAKRADAEVYGTGYQNKTTQLLINKPYKLTSKFSQSTVSEGSELTITPSQTGLVYAVDADNKLITDVAGNGYNDAVVSNNSKGYIQALSISQGNGNELISDVARAKPKNIAYADRTYSDKKGGAGSGSYTTGSGFVIKAPDGSNWFTYDVNSKEWMFYKAGTYCLRVLVCDSEGKSTTSTVYITVAKAITKNEGSGNNTQGH